MRLLHALGYLALPTMAFGAVDGKASQSHSRIDTHVLSSDQEFDYVVVGGGTAGNVLATRLAQQSFSVAVVEAGGIYELESIQEVPATALFAAGTDPSSKPPPVDWGFVIENQPGANYRDIHYARGKCLGGSSALNFMIYQRPTKESMDQWAKAVNDESYTLPNVMPYFKKSVQFTPPNEKKRFDNATTHYDIDAFDPEGGPLQVSYPNYATPIGTWVQKALRKLGFKDSNGFNSGSILGGQYCAMTIHPDTEFRDSSQTSFLNRLKPTSRKVFTNALAKKILFNSDKRATGVHAQGLLGSFTLKAKKEVIVSAGAFQSPQLLMVSGIGPAEILREHHIDPIVELSGVGQNMWDHPFFGITYPVDLPTSVDVAGSIVSLGKAFLRGLGSRTGELTNPGTDYLGWEKVPGEFRSKLSSSTKEDLQQFSEDWPELEYLSASAYVGNFSNPLGDQPKDDHYASILGVLVAPLSRGNVTLRSADTSDLPIINPNWLGTKADQEVAIAAVKRLRQFWQSDAMAPAVTGREYFPGDQVQTDEQILEFVKNAIIPIFHASCTCKMGTKDDPTAVVDNEGRVFGVSGLRVVDASAFPILPPGHPQSAVYMLAEKISDHIIKANPQ